jgi:hypothetical protein
LDRGVQRAAQPLRPLTVVVVILAIAAGWIARGTWERELVGTSVPAPQVKSANASLPPEAVLAVRPAGGRAEDAVKPKISAIRQEINAGRNVGAIYARLTETNPRTPEEQWLLARLVTVCGRVVDPDQPPAAGVTVRTPPSDAARVRFSDSIPADDPNREKRIAAFDGMRRDRCEGMAGVEMQRKEWRGLLEDAAARGNLNARVDLINDDIAGALRSPQKGRFLIPAITSEQVDALKQAVASGDPYALATGMRLLAGGYSNMSLLDGAGQPVDLRAMVTAVDLMGCDSGYPCDGSNRSMLIGCALFDRCAASNLRDYTMYYDASPYTSQRIAQYQQALGDVTSRNDWSGFRFHPGPAVLPGASIAP